MKPLSLRPWHVAVGIVALVALFILPLALAPSDAEFGGTDARVTEMIETDHEAEPWFGSLFSPTPEIESGLFAMQAALGAGVLGFALGRLSRPRKAEKQDVEYS